MYDLDFLRNNFPYIPDPMWSYLYNITYDIDKYSDVKFYFFNSSLDFLYKYSKSLIAKQFAANRLLPDYSLLSRFFNHSLNFDFIPVDCYDSFGQIFYLQTEHCNRSAYQEFFKVLFQKYDLQQELFLEKTGKINGIPLQSIEDCYQKNCISCVRINLASKDFKIYARPFRYNNFQIPGPVKKNLLSVFNCEESRLKENLYDGGTAYDFGDARTLLITQYNDLKKLRKN